MERESGFYFNKEGRQMDTKKFLRRPSVRFIAVLTIVMTVGVILALTSVQLFSGNSLHGAAWAVCDDLQFARLLAMKGKQEYQVVFGMHSYKIVRNADNSVIMKRNVSEEYPGIILDHSAVTFSPRGICTPKTIKVTNFWGTKNISVTPMGAIHLE